MYSVVSAYQDAASTSRVT